MLTQQELEKSPLFQDISYEEYRRMLVCFQAVQKSYRRRNSSTISAVQRAECRRDRRTRRGLVGPDR